MSNRFSRLLKHELMDWAKNISVAILIFIGITILSWIIFRIFGWGDGFHSWGIFNLITTGIVTFIMWIAGIVSGAEVPEGVRSGISRMESFVSKATAAVVVAFLAGPLLFLLNLILSVLPGTLTVYLPFSIDGLAINFLAYIAAFCIGFFIAILWQRIGWLPTLILIFATVIITGWLGLRIFSYHISETAVLENVSIQVSDVNLDNLGDFIQEVVDAAIDATVDGNTSLIILGFDGFSISGMLATVGAILVFGTGAFVMLKKLPVKVH